MKNLLLCVFVTFVGLVTGFPASDRNVLTEETINEATRTKNPPLYKWEKNPRTKRFPKNYRELNQDFPITTSELDAILASATNKIVFKNADSTSFPLPDLIELYNFHDPKKDWEVYHNNKYEAKIINTDDFILINNPMNGGDILVLRDAPVDNSNFNQYDHNLLYDFIKNRQEQLVKGKLKTKQKYVPNFDSFDDYPKVQNSHKAKDYYIIE